MEKPIYKAISHLDFIYSVFLKFLCLGGIGYLYFQYDQNPRLIVIFCCICFYMFLSIGNDEIKIYPGKLVQVNTSIRSSIFRSGSETYLFSDIRRAFTPEKAKSSAAEVTLAVGLMALLPVRSRTRHRNNRSFFLELRNGKIVQIDTCVRNDQVKKIVEMVNASV